jgi:hypothetical protein
MEGSPGLTEGGTGGRGGGGTEAVTRNGALGPQTYDSGTCQHLAFGVWFVNSIKREMEGNGRSSVCIHVGHSLFRSPFVFDAHLHRSKFPLCDSCMVSGVLCQTEMLKDGVQRTSCNRCRQLKKLGLG